MLHYNIGAVEVENSFLKFRMTPQKLTALLQYSNATAKIIIHGYLANASKPRKNSNQIIRHAGNQDQATLLCNYRPKIRVRPKMV